MPPEPVEPATGAVERVVSITSMAVERDSRTYKFAASVARLGYESVVVEGEPSRLNRDQLPFRLLSPPAPDAPQQPESTETSALDTAKERLPAATARPLAWLVRSVKAVVGPIHNAAWVLRFNFADYRRRNRETAALLPDADVYWLHSFFQAPAAWLKTRRARARFLYDTPDAYWEPPGLSPPQNRAQALVFRVFEAIEKRCVKRAERFTTVSDGVAGLMERRFGRRPEVIRNCHDLRLDREPERDIRAVTGVGPDQFLLVMTGNLKGGMTVREALAALRALPESVHLAFVGRSHDQSRAMVDEMGLSGRVHLLAPVPPTEVVRFISAADASPILYRPLTPSYRFSLPNGFFHAVAAGLPILYPPLPEIAALGAEHDLGVGIEPTDPRSIAAGVRALIGDEDATARYRANVARARQELNWEHEEAILARLLQARPVAR